LRHLYPIVTTAKPRDCRDFYVRAMDAHVMFDSEWYVHLSIGGWEIGFLKPNQGKRMPVFQHTTLSRGLCIAIEVPDVEVVYEKFVQRRVETLGPPERYPTGESSFSALDPAGVVLNIVERTTGKSDVMEV
jgi:catechol 2,3-dioxygenase-like lactoylglutathione lyase family enzyme